MTTTIAKWLLAVATAMAMVAAGAQALGQETAPAAPREVPSFQLVQPKLDGPSEVRRSALIGVADLGLRAGEAGVGVGIAGLEGLAVAAAAFGPDVVLLAFFAILDCFIAPVLVFGAPALNAFVASRIGGDHGKRRLGQLMLTSYVSQLLNDAIAVGLSLSSAGILAGLLSFAIGSVAGSAAMGATYALTSSATRVAPQDVQLPAVALGPTIPVAAPQGATFRF